MSVWLLSALFKHFSGLNDIIKYVFVYVFLCSFALITCFTTQLNL